MIQHPMLSRFSIFVEKGAFQVPNLVFAFNSTSVSSSKNTAALVSRYSARRRGSSGERRRSLLRASTHSSSRCFIINHLGENGRKNIPKNRIQAGINCSASGTRHETGLSPRQVCPCASVALKVPSKLIAPLGTPAGLQSDPPTKCIL